jgi:hypothetical protein
MNEITEDLKLEADIVTMIEFVEHITYEDLCSTLNSLKPITKFDHTLIVTTPNYRSPWPLLEKAINIFSKGIKYDQQHISRYNKKKLRLSLENNGYKIISVYGIQGLASFAAPISWKLAEVISKFERSITKFWGFQIICVAQKKL